MPNGVIFEIEEFAVHDGPGIRKVIFMKGCPLRCNWCHNPEGMLFERELIISQNACVRCGKCTDVCRHRDKCINCFHCVYVCTYNLRKICGVEYESSSLAKEILKGKDILEKSGGGVTFSGGEPLSQHLFLLEVIKNIKPIHIAIETSGYADEKIFQSIVNEVDLVLIDFKLFDGEEHKKYTGVDNEIIKKNIKHLCSSGKAFRVRIPLIPSVNDTKDNIENTARFLKDAKNMECVEILPYHKTAGAKYEMLGREYKPIFDTEKKLNIYTDIFEKYNIRSKML